jgi:hypothetical protein
MHKATLRKRLFAALMTLTLVAPPALADESISGDKSTDMAVDLIVVRPLGISATVIGAAGFVIALPFTLPTGTTGETAREWVARPFEYTFNRPLGQFYNCGRDHHPCGHGR